MFNLCVQRHVLRLEMLNAFSLCCFPKIIFLTFLNYDYFS